MDAMSWDEFGEHEAEICAQVRTILAAKAESRRRFRIVAIYERATNELMAEVFRTTYGPVLAYRHIDFTEPHDPINGEVLIGYRTSNGYNNIAPITGDDRETYQFKSRAQWYLVTGYDLRTRDTHAGALAYN